MHETTVPLLFGAFLGLFFCTAFQRPLDAGAKHLADRIRRWLAETARHKATALEQRLLLTSRLIASLRAGLSLDAAMEEALPTTTGELRYGLLGALRLQPSQDFLSVYLAGALRTGAPALATLQSFAQLLRAEQKAERRARAGTSQARAQAEVLSWLPWLLAAALLCTDSEWRAKAFGSASSWALWAAACALTGAGRIWMKLQLSLALQPRGEAQRIEEQELPALVRELLARLAAGDDAQTALEQALAQRPSASWARNFSREPSHSPLGQLRETLAHGAATGAPLRDELTALLGDLHHRLESRWEERVQRLPLLLLAPLFLCFFPSGLLAVAAVLAPLFQELT